MHYVRVLCTNCDTSFFNKIIKNKPIYDYKYNEHFLRPGDLKKASIMGKKIAKLALDTWAHPSVFEIGVGNGLTLWEIMKFGIPVAGCDIDKKLCKAITEKLSIPVYAGGIEHLKPRRKYKIVYSSHVIEHFENPHVFMKKAVSLMDKDGILYIDTPDISQNKRLDPEWHHFKTRNQLEHCCVLSPRSIEMLAYSHNLIVRWLKQFNKFESLQAILSQKNVVTTKKL